MSQDTDLLERLLSFGYFPKELPFCFSTKTFAASNLKNVDLDPNNNKDTFELCRHSFTKYGLNRRMLGIVNPKPFLGLAQTLCNHWSEIKPRLNSPMSLTLPNLENDHTADEITRSIFSTDNNRLMNQAEKRSQARFVAKADIANFYPSIYTHSIPWAIHGREVSKRHRGLDLLGNLLDFWLMKGNSGQTIGISIGNDISPIIAEIILSCIDTSEAIGPYSMRGIRWVDDYEFYLDSLESAERIVSLLHQKLNIFELRLNDSKTSVLPLPQPMEESWVRRVRSFQIRSGLSQFYDINILFDYAFEIQTRSQKTHAVKFTLGRFLRDHLIQEKNWAHFQNLLCQCMITDPGCLPVIAVILKRYNMSNYDISDNVHQCLNKVLKYSILHNHGNEIAWALWIACDLDIKITDEVAKNLEKIQDAASAILYIYAYKKGVISKRPSFEAIKGFFDDPKDSIRESKWLCVYEVHSQGWLSDISVSDCSSQWDVFFQEMLDENIKFLDFSEGERDINSRIDRVEKLITTYSTTDDKSKIKR